MAFSIYPKGDRIIDFVVRGNKLMDSPRFKEAYPDGYKPQQMIGVTPGILKLIFGKRGFCAAGVELNYGKFSELAMESRKAYDALKAENMYAEMTKQFENLKNVSIAKVQTVVTTLGQIAEEFKFLDEETKKELAPKTSDLFSKVSLAATGGLFGSGVGLTAAGITTCAIVKPYLDAGWLCWEASWPGWMTAAEAFEAGAAEFYGISNVALMTAGSVVSWVGIAVASIAALTTLIVAIYKKYKNYTQHKKDVALLNKIEPKLSKIKKLLMEINGQFDKYGANTGKLENFLEKQSELWDDFIDDEKKSKEKKHRNKFFSNIAKRFKKEKKAAFKRDEDIFPDELKAAASKKELQRASKMEQLKVMIARMITHLVLKDAEQFKKDGEREMEAKKIAQQYEHLLFGDKKSEKNETDEKDAESENINYMEGAILENDNLGFRDLSHDYSNSSNKNKTSNNKNYKKMKANDNEITRKSDEHMEQ